MSKTNILNPNRYVIQILIFVLAASCRSAVEVTSIPIEPTVTKQYGSTPVETPTPTLSPTTKIPLITETSVLPLTTLTPLPTLSTTMAQSKVQDLLVDDPPCILPCWWGIEPGLTTWSEGFQFLMQFIVIDRMAESIGNYYEKDVMIDGEIYIKRHLRMILELSNGERVVVGLEGLDDEIDLIEVFISDSSIEDYRFHNFLSTYGVPDEVLLNFRGSLEGIAPFSVYLYYEDKRILAFYEWNADITDDFIYGCPLKTVPIIRTWSVGNLWAEDRLDRELTEPHIPFMSLEEATDMDLVAFHEIFSRVDSESCIETPADIWLP